MPMGRRWNPTLHRWVKRGESKPADYSGRDEKSWALLFSYFRWYPDRLLALCQSEDADFTQQFIQALIWRVDARYKETFVTGSRGLSKTYTKMAGAQTEMLLWPGEKIRYFAPALNQAADLARSAFEQVSKNYPSITNQVIIRVSGKDDFALVTDTTSEFRVTTKRGDNCNQVIAEECGQEDDTPFDWDRYKTVVDATNRKLHLVNGVRDPNHIDFKKHYITSASSQQNDSFKYRCDIFNDMIAGRSAFAIDIPWTVSVLSGIRDYEYFRGLKKSMTPEQWARECESIYTGAVKDPVISDAALTQSQVLKVMEDKHCGDQNCIYIIGYDVSHESGAYHAKCAVSVVKLTSQTGRYKEDVYLKQIVYLDDMPPREAAMQAQYLKQLWQKYTLSSSNFVTYISIDDKQYGKAVTEQLMKDMGDGVPLCCINHDYAELERPGALPVIYPIKASNGTKETGNSDPDGEMIKYAKAQFENGNVKMLVPDHYIGVEAYKKVHHIVSAMGDIDIARPYLKCREMSRQIKNLQIKYRGMNWSESRINNGIQRDMWSATKYALRLAQILERRNMIQAARRNKDYKPLIEAARAARPVVGQGMYHSRVLGRRGRVC